MNANSSRAGEFSRLFIEHADRIEAILKREGLIEAFGIIVGGEDVAEFKPHPEGLLKAVRALHCTPQDAVYVGDSPTDAETAERAGVPFIAVLSGVTPREGFVSSALCAILQNITELPLLLDSAT